MNAYKHCLLIPQISSSATHDNHNKLLHANIRNTVSKIINVNWKSEDVMCLQYYLYYHSDILAQATAKVTSTMQQQSIVVIPTKATTLSDIVCNKENNKERNVIT